MSEIADNMLFGNDQNLTKADQYTERVTMVLSLEQRIKLTEFARKIQSNGSKKPERITVNTVLRCMIDAVMDLKFDISEVSSEKDLLKVMKKINVRNC